MKRIDEEKNRLIEGGDLLGNNWEDDAAPRTAAQTARPVQQPSVQAQKPSQSGKAPVDTAVQVLSGSTEPFTYESAPMWASKYSGHIRELADQILGRGEFSYDHAQDPRYQALEQQYTTLGQQAMQDTLAQVSARTGGLASSYAGTAAQQAYQRYMQELAGYIPELEQAAYSMYQDEADRDMQRMNMLMGMEDTDYSRHQDMLGQFNKDRSMAYEQYLQDREFDYAREQDALDRDFAERQFEYAQEQDALDRSATGSDSDSLLEIAKLMAEYGDDTLLRQLASEISGMDLSAPVPDMGLDTLSPAGNDKTQESGYADGGTTPLNPFMTEDYKPDEREGEEVAPPVGSDYYNTGGKPGYAQAVKALGAERSALSAMPERERQERVAQILEGYELTNDELMQIARFYGIVSEDDVARYHGMSR